LNDLPRGSAATEERLRALLAAVPIALFEAGLDGSWTFGQGRLREALGFPEGERLEEGIARCIDPADREAVVAAWREALAVSGPFRAEFRVAAPGGGARWLRARAVPLREGNGPATGYAGVLEDVTEDREREEGLREEVRRERERSHRKSEFVAVLSHELRTPLHGVVGTAGLLQSTPLNPEQREYVEMLAQSADATLSVIHNVLDLSKIEAGRLDLDIAPFEIRDVAERAVSLFAGRAHGQGVELACLIRPGVPGWAVGDAERLRQVLVNLLGNAIKFTEKGEVILTVSAAPAAAGEPHLLRFEVADTGIGFDPATRDRLFEPFVQADAGIATRYGGTGLGLTICRQIVRLMGGTMGAESRPGKGSTFWFTAALGRPAHAPPPAPAPEDVRGRRVLLVDDHGAAREAAAGLLRGFDCLVLEAASAAEGLEALRRGVRESSFVDAVVLDMTLPGEGEARAFVDRVRADPALEGVKVLLATPFGHRARVEAARWEGIAAFLARPVRRDDLRDCLAAAFSGEEEGPYGRAARPRAPAVSATGSFRIARILVVDDNEVNRKIAVKQLERKGFLVETASDGREAVDRAATVPYDLIFMDWMMPTMDGFEATRRIRDRERGSGFRVPIVAMTARALEGDREKCLEPGMDDYLTKPVKFEELDGVLERWLAPRPNAPVPPPLPPTPPPAEGPVEVDRSSIESLAALQSEGEPDIVKELVDIFEREAGPRFERLRAAAAAADPGELMREAHGLKGTAASIGAKRLAGLAKDLEDRGRTGQTAGATERVAALREAYGAAAAILKVRAATGRWPA
jgi:two-component system sensor histidine kinase/response regulator